MHKIYRASNFVNCRTLRILIKSNCNNNSTATDIFRRESSSSTNLGLNYSTLYCISKKTLKDIESKIQQITKMSSNIIPSDPTSSSATASGSTPKYTNRLIKEKSPYLLQHAHNPVDWYPWCGEAIQRAKQENKIIFLSVGYSTCHWCHVMEHESFENEEIAKFMNENFINIKVDREERPDIDKIYMNFLLMVNGSGGWPMSVWLTPDLTPITAGTYFPPVARWGSPSFKTVLEKIADNWKKNQKEILDTGYHIIKMIEKSLSEKTIHSSSNDLSTPEMKLKQAILIYKRQFDEDYGGFRSSGPKFPQVSQFNLLFHAYSVTKDKDIIRILLKTLEKIGNGGIHDHVFGGFARYSVDRKWHVPHFEKMLYDQGQLLSTYANAYKITKNEYFLEIADGIYRYLIKDLQHPDGGFYSGEDADSLPTFNDTHKVEGAFYAWTYSEIQDEFEKNSEKFKNLNIVGCENAELAFKIYSRHYDVQEKGNVEIKSDPHGHLTNKNILIVRKNLKATAKKFNLSIVDLKRILKLGNEILHEVRDKRPRPHLDTKIITAWNGLVLSGLAKISMSDTEKREDYLNSAKKLIQFVKENLYDAQKQILLRSCYGKGTNDSSKEILSDPISGFLDDYAFLIKGLLDYYKATLDLSALEWARELQDIQDKLFWDDTNGGYFYSQENSPNVIIRLKEDGDGAEPCGNSVAARNLLLISAYFEEPDYKARAKKLFDYFDDPSTPMGYSLPEMLSALLLYDRGLEMTAVVGPDNSEVKKFLDVCRKFYIPGMIAVHFNVDNPSVIKRKTAEKFKMINGQTTVYICHNKACQLPITDPQKLEEVFKTKYVLENDYESDSSDDE